MDRTWPDFWGMMSVSIGVVGIEKPNLDLLVGLIVVTWFFWCLLVSGKAGFCPMEPLRFGYDAQRDNSEVWRLVHRSYLLDCDDLEILMQYNAEIRGLYNFYRLANNVSVLNKFYYVMKLSMLRTFADKYRVHVSNIVSMFCIGKNFVVWYPRKFDVGSLVFYNRGFCRDTRLRSGDPDPIARMFESYGRCGLIKWLLVCRCEFCGGVDVFLEVHHLWGEGFVGLEALGVCDVWV
jgi:hypothetical protein